MPVVPCPHCSNAVSLPDPWTGTRYVCPHCRRAVATAPPPSPPPPPEESFDLDPAPRPRRRRQSGSPVVDFLTFRLMITPILIQVVFWVGVVLCLGSGMVQIAGSFRAPADDVRDRWDARDDDRFAEPRPGAPRPPAKPNAAPATKFSPLLFAFGLATMTLGPLMVRLYCELLIIIFKIHDELKTANDRQRYRG